ncbi:unnamed protein product [Caenorhabditis brenneri]
MLKIDKKASFGKWIFQDLQENTGDAVLIGGHRMNVCVEESDLCTDTNGNFLNCVYTGIQYIKKLFKKPVHQIKIKFENTPWHKLFVGPEACEILYCCGNDPVDNRVFETILNSFTMSHGFYFNVPIPQNFPFDFTDIKANYISLHHAHWVTKEMIFASKSHGIALYNTRFTSSDCVEFVRHWMLSDNTTLESLRFTSTVDRFTRFHFDRNETSDWDEQQRGRYFKWSIDIAFDCQTGRDFLLADGMLATVYSVNGNFMFLVWKERFHNVTECPYVF